MVILITGILITQVQKFYLCTSIPSFPLFPTFLPFHHFSISFKFPLHLFLPYPTHALATYALFSQAVAFAAVFWHSDQSADHLSLASSALFLLLENIPRHQTLDSNRARGTPAMEEGGAG